jgi:hypothetical protein
MISAGAELRDAARIGVVLPYFQREAGLLQRPLNSVATPEHGPVHVVVVNHDSPRAAEGEIGRPAGYAKLVCGMTSTWVASTLLWLESPCVQLVLVLDMIVMRALAAITRHAPPSQIVYQGF